MFNEQSFSQRLGRMGDQSEAAFEDVANSTNIQFVRYGFNRPPITKFAWVPAFIRSTPDYLAQVDRHLCLVECKGTIQNTVKIKVNQIEQLNLWNDYLPVVFFVFDSKKLRTSFMSYSVVIDLVKDLPVLAFENDGNEYFEVPVVWDQSLADVIG